MTFKFHHMNLCSDNLPRFHRLDEGVFAFCGYNGRGIAPGTVFGRIMAGFLSGELAQSALPLPVTSPAPAAFRALRAAFYEAGAQLAHLCRLP